MTPNWWDGCEFYYSQHSSAFPCQAVFSGFPFGFGTIVRIYTQAKAISHDDKIFPFIFHRWNTRSQCTYETIKEPYVLGRFPSIVNRFVLLRAVSHIESIPPVPNNWIEVSTPIKLKNVFRLIQSHIYERMEDSGLTKKYRNIVYHNVIDKLCLFFVSWQFSKEKIND